MGTEPEVSPVEIYDYFFFWLVIVAVSAVLILRDTGTGRHKAFWLVLFALLPCVSVVAYYFVGGATRDWGARPRKREKPPASGE